MVRATTCPKCSAAFERLNFGPHVSLERCTGCHGIWCLSLSPEDIDAIPMLDTLDIGDARRGAVYDRVTEVRCPLCKQPMATTRVPKQPHITVETCAGCAGVFLDAGELRDLKTYSVRDWFKAVRLLFDGR